MRRNSNCCNQNRCYHNDRDFSPSDKCIASREPHGYLFMNQCDVFAALSTTAQTVTGTAVAPLTLSNILYQYGTSIQAATSSYFFNITINRM